MREGVPVVTLTGTYLLPSPDERRELAKMLNRARDARKPAKDSGSVPLSFLSV
jgi:hypothetical protein